MFKSSHSHTVDDKTKRSFTMMTGNKSFLFVLIGALTLVSSSGIDVAPVGLETVGSEHAEHQEKIRRLTPKGKKSKKMKRTDNDMCPKLTISKLQSKHNEYAVDAQKFNNEYCNLGLEAIEKAKKSEDIDEAIQELTLPPGTLDLKYYTSVAKAFVGLNPISGDGSGFIYRESTNTAMDDPTSFGNVPPSGGGRNNLCTCACEPSDSGVGCAGHAGINFRYGTVLWIDPITGAWTGQIQALQNIGTATDPVNLNFLGTDTRLFPGGPAIYNVACTQAGCSDVFAGVFRQPNDVVSCKAGLAEQLQDPPTSGSCFTRCGDSGIYKEWLAYCSEETDTSKETGFSGYGV